MSCHIVLWMCISAYPSFDCPCMLCLSLLSFKQEDIKQTASPQKNTRTHSCAKHAPAHVLLPSPTRLCPYVGKRKVTAHDKRQSERRGRTSGDTISVQEKSQRVKEWVKQEKSRKMVSPKSKKKIRTHAIAHSPFSPPTHSSLSNAALRLSFPFSTCASLFPLTRVCRFSKVG